MTEFCFERLQADPRLLPVHGVLHASARERTADAHQLAGQIVAQARRDAQQILDAAAQEAQHTVHEAQARVLAQAMALQQGMDDAMAALLEQAHDIVAELAGTLYERLVLETAPQQKVAAMCRRLLREAPPKLVNAVLRLHPQDMPAPDGLPWPCQADAGLEPGSCRLEADSGEWRAEFDAAAAALQQALAVLPLRTRAGGAQADS